MVELRLESGDPSKVTEPTSAALILPGAALRGTRVAEGTPQQEACILIPAPPRRSLGDFSVTASSLHDGQVSAATSMPYLCQPGKCSN